MNEKNKFDEGWTALHYAVHEGNFELVKLLVENYKTEMNQLSTTDKTPLHLACVKGEKTLIEYLI